MMPPSWSALLYSQGFVKSTDRSRGKGEAQPPMTLTHILLIGLGILLLILLCLLLEAARDLIKTPKRLEARMTLQNPLDKERQILERSEVVERTTRCALEDRAIQPDVWEQMVYEDIRELAGEDRKKRRELWRYREREHRS